MPKIKTVEFNYSTEEKSHLKFKVAIYVDSSGRFYFYTIELPTEIKDMLGVADDKKDQTNCKDPQDGIKMIRKYVDDYKKFLMDKTERKVIVYEFQIQGALIPDDPDATNYTGLTFNEISRLDHASLGLSMRWSVVKEVSIGGKVQFIEDERRTDDYADFRVILWTQVREDWFKSTEDSFKKLLLGIHAMRSMDDQKFVTSIDQGYLLLGGPVESKDKVSKRR